MITESSIIWGGALGLSSVILVVYLRSLRRRELYQRQRLAEAQRLGIDRPRAQFPYVDPEICMGCGGCVKACPEGDVLGIVGGLAVVINGVRCVGIGQCAKACPVSAIEIGLGDLKGRADVPVTDERSESNVPGIFIAGELGGLALIRNAVEQGRDAVRRIADELATRPRSPDPAAIDLAIVGAGPAGLSAALSAVERGLSYAVFEQESSFGGTIFHYPRRKLTHTQPVELPLYGRLHKEEHTKEELLELFEGLVERHQLRLEFGQKVQAVDRVDSAFAVRTTTGTHRARCVLLALGRRGTPRKLGVPGEDHPKVMYQVRDAEQYRHAKILCVGGGDSAVEAAMGLASQPGVEVTLSYRKEQFFRIKNKNQQRLRKKVDRGRVKLLMRSQVLAITETSVRLAAEEGEITIDNDYVFVLIGGVPPFPFLRQVGIKFGDEIEPTAAGQPAAQR